MSFQEENSYGTKTDRRLKRMSNKFNKTIKHKIMGINRGLSKSMKKIMVESKITMSSKKSRKH